MIQVVTLIPWRAGDDRREWLWDLTRPYIEALGYPLVLGAPNGNTWSRAEAVNNAAKTAGKWDVALIADTDTIPEPGAIRRAVKWVLDSHGGVRPHMDRWQLSELATMRFAHKGYASLFDKWTPIEIEGYPKGLTWKRVGGTQDDRRWACAGGGLLVVTREAFEKVGGYDERFKGWGYEDTAMNINLLQLASWDRLPGNSWHLYHDSQWATATGTTKKLWERYHKENATLIIEWAANKGLRYLPEEVV